MAQVRFEGKTNSDGNSNYLRVYISGLDTNYTGSRWFKYSNPNSAGTIIDGGYTKQFDAQKSENYSFDLDIAWSKINFTLQKYENWLYVVEADGTASLTYPPKKWTEWDNLISNNIIQSATEGISATSWNRFIDEIIDLRKYLGVNPYETELNAIKANSGDLITAKAYNTARYYIGRTEEDSETKDVVAGETIITADHFKKLAADFNKYI